MNKTAKILLVIALLLVLVPAGMIFGPRFLLGIDIFDLSGWSQTGGGDFRYLDYYGKPLKGWQTINGNWYYFHPDSGNMAVGLTEVDGTGYYMNEAGIRQSGWVKLPQGKYYFDPETSAAVSGWLELDGDTYYVDESGRICTGLTEVGGKQYFLGSDGKRRSGWTEVEGKRYFLDAEGCIATGWADTEFGRSYFLADGSLGHGWTDTDEGRYYLTATGTVATGWLDTAEGWMYLDDQGQVCTGWTETDTGRTYLTEAGIALTGWQEVDGKEYFFRDNGLMAIGKVVQDEKTYYFSSSGQLVPLVNKWNSLPEDYTVELVSYGKHQIAAEAHEYLVAMIDQIKGLGYYNVTSIYRSKATQQSIWDRYYNNYRAVGSSKAEAERLTGEKVAVPGTSEHHLGYAVDIDGVKPVHNWLAEHSWEYGFIVRYPDGTTDITGIEYEPWHFRFVGLELAKELHDLGLTLEEYMDMLTKQAGSDAGTASNPEKFG